jgi:hypothetical protein
MCDDCANHDDGKQDGRVECVTGYQQADCARYFQKTGEVPKPLAKADLIEHFDHYRDTGQLGAAGAYEGHGDKTGKRPESDEAALAGGGWQRVCRYHEVPFKVVVMYIDINILDFNSMMRENAEWTQRKCKTRLVRQQGLEAALKKIGKRAAALMERSG